MAKVSANQVGQRIRRVRGRMTQTHFAKAVGVRKQNYISRYEHGRIPSPELLVRIADFGKTSVDWVLTGKGKAPRAR
jgi:transcriptional regulator with XRE-family HTH domain